MPAAVGFRALGVCSACLGAGQSRVETYPGDVLVPSKQLFIHLGSEFAPDAPWGLEVLSVASGGAVRYENRDHGRRRVVGGAVSRSRAEHLFDLLAASSFPVIPKHRFPPGASIVRLSLRSGGQSQTLDFDQYFAEELPGFGELLSECDSFARAIRTNDAATLQAWEFQESPATTSVEGDHDDAPGDRPP